MTILLDGHELVLLPRVAAMTRLIIEHQREIENYKVGCVFLDYSPVQVDISIKVKRSRARVVDGE